MLNHRSRSLDPIREDALQVFKNDFVENQPETFYPHVGTGKNMILDGTFGKATTKIAWTRVRTVGGLRNECHHETLNLCGINLSRMDSGIIPMNSHSLGYFFAPFTIELSVSLLQ
jgi:hypothetical protein